MKKVLTRAWYFLLGANAMYLGMLAWAYRAERQRREAERQRRAEVAESIKADLERKAGKVGPIYPIFDPRPAPRTPGFRPKGY